MPRAAAAARALLLAVVLPGCALRMPPTPPTAAAVQAPARTALDALWQDARAHHTDALVVLHRGELLLAWPPVEDQVPIETMSVTKSIVSLGVGLLLDQGHVDDVDRPMATWIPEWAGDARADITLRHVLEHRSGLHQGDDNRDIYRSRDALGHATASPLDSPPGTDFRYNNTATNALAAVFPAAAGQELDEFIGAELFAPLGITAWSWYRDAGGHPHGMSGLRLRAVDLARVGQLLLDEGRVDGTPLVSADWLARSTTPTAEQPWSAWLWWPVHGTPTYLATPALLDLWISEGASAEALAGLETERFPSAQAFRAALRERLGGLELAALGTRVGPHIHPLERRVQVGVEAQGYLGQYLLVLPEHELVVVRQTRGRKGRDTDFTELRGRVLDLGAALSD